MRHRLVAFILLGLLSVTSYAQTGEMPLTPSALLNRAYALASSLPLEIRFSLLTNLANTAVKKDVAAGREWARELFAVSQQLPPGPGRDSAQSLAVWAMSHWDSDTAFKMACELEPPSSAELAVFTNRRSESIRGVFSQVTAGGNGLRSGEVSRNARSSLAIADNIPTQRCCP